MSISSKIRFRRQLSILAITWLFPATVQLAAEGQVSNQRQITIHEMARRPEDPWPRGDGHVVLGEPGSPLGQKGYHEPGGSFTPSPGSFGISIWVRDANNNLVATSDSIPIERIQQRYVFAGDAKVPAIEDTTPYYAATWTYAGLGLWTLDLRKNSENQQIEIVCRSVGPAGGPLESVIWDQSRLLINRRWIVQPDTVPSAVVLGDESAGNLRTALSMENSVTSTTGWAFARLVSNKPTLRLKLTDTKPQFASELSYSKTVPQFSFKLPDLRFEDSLRAQVATLMVAYTGRQTGPGEPINYPLAWERDGAYSLMAMAKCGQLQTARELSVYFAENDFFGGFGAEGDAPGSASNALIELAFLLNDRDYYEWLWPHIVRKMGLVDEMMNAKTDVYKEYIGPLAPHLQHDGRRHELICHAANAGLIVGSMDLHFPVLYINAISYRGLKQSSKLAAKLGHMEEAALWESKAKKLQAAWKLAFGQPDYDDERNFMISIWPSWIVNKDFRPFSDQFEHRYGEEWESGQPKSRPLWTYFTVAEAHQWLFLERPERTWQTLNYFFNHQCAPGLYTYWEGEGEENTFKQWENYRGWLKPPYVTPHYWTASEMLNLQLDMLVYIDESQPQPEIVIGAGVPAAWLDKPMVVDGFRTKAGLVSWRYSSGELKIQVSGSSEKVTVRPGLAFRDNHTKVTVNYE